VIFSYHAYGLHCLSDTAIPGFAPEETETDVADLALWIGPDVPAWALRARSLPVSVVYSKPQRGDNADCWREVTSFGYGQFFEIAHGDGARFLIDAEGTRLWARWSRPLTIEYLATYLTGPVMGFILRKRGVTALHASAVCVDGHAVVLCGPSEAGKSTTAAALALRGTPVLADDIAALKFLNDEFVVEPGYPRICLWPATVRNLLGAPDALPRLTSDWEKCYLPLDGKAAIFEKGRRPLAAIYLLAARETGSDTPRIQEASARTAVLELVQNTYMNYVLDPQQRAAEFDMLTKISRNVPVRTVIPHSDITRIDALSELVLSDVEGILGCANSLRIS
jgi:hypothetical protein